ncbi:MAG TPA: M20/M25/M40 family metallo-hydrolase [Pyrinomonadaceae bacterium]|nr:M20/M25/M40 family metallo-hydrolase [Pyrinomonadaceae bacterium]
MKQKFFIFLLILSFVFSVSAQTAKLDPAEKNLRTHVAYLASDRLEGRRTGEQGATFAAGYVANMFAQNRLKAGVSQTEKGRTKNSFMQTFPFFSGVELGRDNFLRIIPENSTRENKMEIGVNWMPVGFSTNGYVPPAPLVFAGYGIASSELKYDDYAGLDVKDKIVLVFDGTPETDNPHSQFAHFNLHAKAKIAQEKGAKALIVIARENNFKEDDLAQLKYDQTLGETAIPTVVIMRSHGADLFDVKDLAEIEKWTAKRQDAPENVREKFANPPKAVAQMQVNLTKKQTAEAYNVIGILEGNDAILKNEAIVIGAHYDHLGRGGRGSLAANSAEIHNGADDNASGVAAMLELARQFSQAKSNRRTLIFIAFGGEEEGLLGSKFYVNNPVFPLDKTAAMINLDMVGRLKDDKLTIGGIGTASEWRSLVTRIQPTNLGKTEVIYGTKIENIDYQTKTPIVIGINGQPVATQRRDTPVFNLQLNEDGFGPSDHSSFYGKQIPVLFFFTGTHADYHKPSDTAEKINYDGLIKITNFVGEIVKAIDQNPKKPTYTVAKSSGMGGRTTFSVSLGTVPSYAESNDGLLLDGVRDDSPAAKAGLKAGDKIIKLAGRDIRNVSDYTFVLSEMKAGETYEVVVLRGTGKLTLKIVPASRK